MSAQPYGYFVPAGGQPPPVQYPPATPVMGAPGMMPGYPQFGGQPPIGYYPGMGQQRGRGRGGGGQNVVNRVKAEITTARPGQVLEIAREAASQLSARHPQLYVEFLKGLGIAPGTTPPSASPVYADDDGVKKPADASSLLTERMQKWKAACHEHEDASYFMGVVEDYKSRMGPQCEVDKEILAKNSDVDIARYHRGRYAREQLLTMNGLSRDQGKITLDLKFVPEKPKFQPNPLLDEEEKEDAAAAYYKWQEETQAVADKTVSRMTEVLAQQAKASDARFEKLLEVLSKRGSSPPPPPK